MAQRSSASNPLSYVVARQIDDKVDHCKRLVNARFEGSENLFRKDLLSHYGCVNAIEFSRQGDLLVSGGDDRRVLLWRVEQAIQNIGKPVVMRAQHASNIFSLGYDSSTTKIFSAGNDDQVIVHDLRTSDALNFFLHEQPVYGLSIHPHNDNVFASAGDDGRVLIYDIRGSSAMDTFCLAEYKTPFHSVMFNPVEPIMLATANAKEGVSMWDVRKPLEPVLRYGNESPAQSCMNVRFNAAGNRLLALRRRLPPVLYAVDSSMHLCQFDHPGYYNSCTMKSCCFAGDNDEYVLSGSDDFNLYMWKIPSEGVKWVDSAHMVLRGHRSIVNQVRYNPASCVLASSGVEKIIKIWSPFTLGNGCLGGLKSDAGKQERQREVFTRDEYIRLVLHTGQFMTHDYSHQSTREDPRMMAFFDALVQREIVGYSSDEPTAPQTSSATDSEDSTVNPITRLIVKRREKLMRLAALDCGGAPLSNSSNAAQEQSGSGSASDAENAQMARKRRSKSKTKLRGVKRKHGRISGRRSRRKCTVLRIDSDTDSEQEDQRRKPQQQQLPIDATQPSTSSGVISRRSRYATTPIESDTKHSSYSSTSCNSSSGSSSSEGHETVPIGKKRSKSDSDASVRARRRRHRKYKNNQRREPGKSKGKRPRLEKDSEDGEEEEEEEGERAEKWKKYGANGASDRVREQPADGPSTPVKKFYKVPSTPDSGITSGVSTVEKNGAGGGQARKGHNECSDNEQKLKNLEYFRKKVDVARRSYRNRAAPLSHTTPTTTDSSD